MTPVNEVLMAELEKLSPYERLRLAYGQLDSMAQAEISGQITEAQGTELRRQLADIRREFDAR